MNYASKVNSRAPEMSAVANRPFPVVAPRHGGILYTLNRISTLHRTVYYNYATQSPKRLLVKKVGEQ